MSREPGFVGRVMAIIAGAAALVAVASVGYCIGENNLEERIDRLERENSSLRSQLKGSGSDPRPTPTDSVAQSRTEPQQSSSTPPELQRSSETARDRTDVSQDPNTRIVNGIECKLLGCSRSGSDINCEIRFTSLGRDIKGVYLTTDSIANASGQEVTAERASFGAVRNHRIHGWGDLVADIPKIGSLKFEGIRVSETELALLELKMSADNESFEVRFRNVPLQ